LFEFIDIIYLCKFSPVVAAVRFFARAVDLGLSS